MLPDANEQELVLDEYPLKFCNKRDNVLVSPFP